MEGESASYEGAMPRQVRKGANELKVLDLRDTVGSGNDLGWALKRLSSFPQQLNRFPGPERFQLPIQNPLGIRQHARYWYNLRYRKALVRASNFFRARLASDNLLVTVLAFDWR
jgi:hypothetical protein